ncbi:uncharacterized protein BT62DRAFT_991563 [Guyanagaster necrorhizus]|uniref:Uncharacterized protein n=1 Tax=Guyanagaster necrorhizus TaxID=856835 RepID=A0A9P7VZZ0_9AGAR|nr:uncharacterized protein BT62DRAFT_991563 [Guyanagaster necrorhizus MCA 3950]KAG7450721.1 hypothetical protein BT62DRAFT_991563 [Guyanagaster necrorhizus MCA 3950]
MLDFKKFEVDKVDEHTFAHIFDHITKSTSVKTVSSYLPLLTIPPTSQVDSPNSVIVAIQCPKPLVKFTSISSTDCHWRYTTFSARTQMSSLRDQAVDIAFDLLYYHSGKLLSNRTLVSLSPSTLPYLFELWIEGLEKLQPEWLPISLTMRKLHD